MSTLNTAISSRRVLFIFVCLTLLCSGCEFTRLQRDLRTLETGVIFSGDMHSQAGDSTIVVSLIRQKGSTPVVVNYRIFSKPQSFEFIAEPGSYQVFAFADLGNDTRHQVNEPAARSEVLTGKAGERFDSLVLTIPAEPDQELVAEIKRVEAGKEWELPGYTERLGSVVDLHAGAFTRDNGQLGMWEPIRFLKEAPAGLFFLETYDPQKIPVLFVHGIGGSPRHFEHLIGALDRSRFQPWIVFYPSGFRLETIVSFLDSALNELQARHRVSEIYVVAHSMGGLISRRLVLKDAEKRTRRLITLHVTLSTPWGGHAAAASGVKRAPVVMPVWNDLAPGSEFLANLFEESTPSTTRHYLLFTFRGKASLFHNNNDGVVSLASQLRPEAQAAARLVRGFDTDHTGILTDESAIEYVQGILAEP
jgi:pimeloyl-ACP methyl ester carboxylesterase